MTPIDFTPNIVRAFTMPVDIVQQFEAGAPYDWMLLLTIFMAGIALGMTTCHGLLMVVEWRARV